MLILGDDSRHGAQVPWITWSLIAINVLVFGFEVSVGDRMINGFSLIPEEITSGRDLTESQWITVERKVPPTLDPKTRKATTPTVRQDRVEIAQAPGPFPIYLTFLTSMFMHAGIIHLIGNMYFLFIFGDNIEDALGHGVFLGLYLLSGLAGGLLHIAFDPHSIVPALGASGAISGVMGAYLVLLPFNNIKLWMGWYWGAIEVPALVVIGIWFVGQYLMGVAALSSAEQVHGVAYGAHLGGFGAGFLIAGGLLLLAQLATRHDVGRASPPLAEEPPPSPLTDFSVRPAPGSTRHDHS